MITFHSITAKNFLSIGDNPITLRFDTHKTTLVTGSNGNGKSGAVIEPLVFGLFGKSFRGVVKNGLINSVNQRDCVVTVDFSVGPDKYKIVRGLKPKKFEIYKNGNLENCDAAVRDQQRYLETQILRTNYTAFCQVVILGSAAYIPFMQLKASQRREVIETLLDISVFSGMNKILKTEIAEWKDSITDIRSVMTTKQNAIEMQNGFITKLQTSKTEQDGKKKEELRKLKTRLETLQKERNTLDKNYKMKQLVLDKGNLEFLKEEKQKLVQRSNVIAAETKRYEKDKKFFAENSECPVCDQAIDDAHRNGHIATINKELEKLSTELAEIDTDLEFNNFKIEEATELADDMTRIKTNMEFHDSKIADVKKLAKDMATSLKAEITESTASIEEEEEKLAILKAEYEAADAEFKQLMSKQKEYELAVHLLKDTGIKSAIIKQYLPILNAQVNKYLQTMSFNVKFELDENFNETLRSRFRNEFTYGNFSMGERQRLDLAMLFGWRDVAKLKNSVNCNLLILDEIMDSSLDQEGLDDLMTILNNQNQDINVTVISHRSGIEDKFRNHVRFEKVNDFTRIAES